ncbi:MAG: VWA domain-containing protein, partial [Planctomycetaceae bacterium]|nr:VWA domain-containing protein [Planctomycetaceae bacterium]
LFDRVKVGDIAVDSLDLPEEVSPREPFQFSVYIQADRAAQGKLIIKRDGQIIATSEQSFSLGRNRLLFRDLVDRPGFFTYEAELILDDDPVKENNRGEAGLRVNAGPRLLVLNTDGQPGNLVQALKAGRIDVDVAQADTFTITQDSLDPYQAVIIENIPARVFGRQAMEQLAQFVEDLGGGLLLTGGSRSFGVGGYFNSPLDDILPVSMEIREEHRKNRLALVIALDRSGSMTASVAGGKTKMDLANLGTAECVRLLSSGDSVAIIAVDSSPHTIQGLIPVDDPEAIAGKALGIQSMGGGIFVYEALVAAGQELMSAEQSTKHIILFSDAADSEVPGNYKKLLSDYDKAGITVSVIGLGTTSDPDAKLLEDIAKRGNGNIMFTQDASELPRLFTEDTMSVARSSFIEKDPEAQPDGIAGQQLVDSRLIGDWGGGGFPNIDGYNLSYLKPEATMGVVSGDEYKAPLSAFWYRGLGRVAALSVEVDGKFSGDLIQWDGYSDFVITHARWLLGSASADDVFINIQRDGQDAVATIELDPNRKNRGGNEVPEMIVVPPGADRQKISKPEFSWIGPDTLQSRFRLDQMGTYRTLVKTSDREFQRGPALSLPYSPEFAPRTGLPQGKELLSQLASLTGGEQRTDVLEVFKNSPRSPKKVSLVPHLLTIVIVLLIIEIAGRRLSLWDYFSSKRLASEQETPSAQTAKPRKSVPIRSKKAFQWPGTNKATAVPIKSPKQIQTDSSKDEKQAPAVDVFAQAKNRAQRRHK